jgi:hypothetical protein
MEAIYSSEMSVGFQRTTRRYVSEDNTFSNKKFDFTWVVSQEIMACETCSIFLMLGRLQSEVAFLMLVLTCSEAHLGAGFTFRMCGDLG